MIYNQDKTAVIDMPDLNLGYLKDDILIIKYPKVEGRVEKGHYEVVAEYPETSGKDVVWVIDESAIEAQEERTEEVPIKVYIPYTENELEIIALNNQLKSYNDFLLDTDHLILSYIEGCIDEEEFEKVKKDRNHFREEIEKIENKLAEIVEQ